MIREYDSRFYGEGPDETYLPAPCPVCGGDGGHETWGAFCSVAGDIMRGWQKCTYCDGSGEIETEPAGPRGSDELEARAPLTAGKRQSADTAGISDD